MSLVGSLPVKQKIVRRTSRMNGWQRAGEKPREVRMIRVTESQEGVRTIITLEGQLPGHYIEVAEICCNQAVLKGKPIDVFLHDV
jgi:hypothetical protein